MSYAEDCGHDLGGYLNKEEEQEDEWQLGFHTDREGNKIELSNMTDSHLVNAINFFKQLDTSPLKEELNKRLLNKLK